MRTEDRDRFFRERLKQKIAESGLSHTQIAKKIEDLKQNHQELGLKGKCTYRNIGSWLKDKYPDKYLPLLCEALGIEEADLYPSTHDEQYGSDSDFMNKLKDTEIIPFADKLQLDIEFLRGLRSIVDFETDFPLWTQIGINTHIINSKSRIEDDLGECVLFPESCLADSAPMDDDVFQIKKTIEGKDKLITMGKVDLAFLRWVQKEVQRYVRFLFVERRQDMQEEVRMVNKINRRENLHKLSKGGWGVTDKPIDLTKVDRYIKRAYMIDNKK